MHDGLQEPRRFTVDDVFKMAEAGIIDPKEHLELLGGTLHTMSSQGPAHRSLTITLRKLLEGVFGDRAHLQDHSNLRLDDRNMPEPDLAVVRGHENDYYHRLPNGKDVLLVVEIAVTSQARDAWKAGLYAEAGVAEYWILDEPARTLTVYRRPSAGKYCSVDVLGADDDVAVPESEIRWRIGSFFPLSDHL